MSFQHPDLDPVEPLSTTRSLISLFAAALSCLPTPDVWRFGRGPRSGAWRARWIARRVAG